ncbi:hypothetical protein AUI51_04145 [archaeon 13_1_40CM_2_52_4]|nr:MAG: hypothetical protein AUI51_04145 [archaeon 13_1_40CM_2_52_4]
MKGLLQETGISAPTPPQVEAIPFIVQGENVLIIAPTGSGKTEAALLPLIDKMVQDENRQGVSLLYITPLRALNRDLLKRLQIWSVKLRFTVELRHGDTPAADRRRMAGRPPDLLITTPETLQAVLPGTRMRQHLRHVKAVVVDEIHELAGDRRGVQLTVGLERLREARGERFQRVGLSATVGNPEEIARFLGGPESVRIVQIPLSKNAEYKIEYPPPGEADQELAKRLYTAPEAAARLALVSDLVEAHDSTLIFVNSRVNAEMLGSKFNMMDQKIMVHHGSLPKEERVRAEEAFKARQIKGLVCIAHDEPVVTSNGVKSADDVAIGDEVLSYDLESYSTVFRPVTRKFARKADRLVHVKHEFGLLRVTPNHPLLCLGRNGFSWKPAEEIRVGDALVGVGKVEGKKVATNTLISYPNLFVRNSAIAALGYAPPRPYPKAKLQRFLALRSLMRDEDLLRLTEFTTTQTKYTFPPWVDSGLGYLLGFHKSDGDRHLRFFTTDGRKLLQVQYFLSKLHDGSMHRTITPMHRQSFASNRPLMVLQSHSKPLSDLLSNLWSRLPLEASVVAAFLAAYLDGDGCLEIKDGRLENIQFVTFNPINREYLLFAILSMGFKPKLWKANGMSGDGFGISVSYSDDKTRLFQLVKELSIKANDAGSLDFGNKPKTYYGLGPYLKGVRQNLGISSYKLWKRLNYSTKYEDPARGITCKTLARLNEALDSSLLKHLLQGEFSVSQARAVKTIDGTTVRAHLSWVLISVLLILSFNTCLRDRSTALSSA